MISFLLYSHKITHLTSQVDAHTDNCSYSGIHTLRITTTGQNGYSLALMGSSFNKSLLIRHFHFLLILYLFKIDFLQAKNMKFIKLLCIVDWKSIKRNIYQNRNHLNRLMVLTLNNFFTIIVLHFITFYKKKY